MPCSLWSTIGTPEWPVTEAPSGRHVIRFWPHCPWRWFRWPRMCSGMKKKRPKDHFPGDCHKHFSCFFKKKKSTFWCHCPSFYFNSLLNNTKKTVLAQDTVFSLRGKKNGGIVRKIAALYMLLSFVGSCHFGKESHGAGLCGPIPSGHLLG